MKGNETLLPPERQQRILEILAKEITVRSTVLSEVLKVSDMTIRRDLEALEQAGLVQRTHGGAVFRQERFAGKFYYQHSVKKNPQEKSAIAQQAAALIQPDDTVFIGEGVTASLVARYVAPDMPCTIFTNNLGVVTELGDVAAELVLLAGTYDANSHAVSGSLTMELIRQVHTDIVFLGADGLCLNAGLTTPDHHIAVIERTMIQHTRGRVIVMADHSKFGVVAEMTVTPLKQIDVLITNRKIPEDFHQALDVLHVNVVLAGVRQLLSES